MDRRVYILPVVSVLVVFALLMSPDLTGRMVATRGFENQIVATLSISTTESGLIPQDSVVTVYLDNEKSSMPFADFVKKSGKGFIKTEGEIPEIGYEGPGFGGPFTYEVGISEFGIDRTLEPGDYILLMELSYGDYVISQTTQSIEI